MKNNARGITTNGTEDRQKLASKGWRGEVTAIFGTVREVEDSAVDRALKI